MELKRRLGLFTAVCVIVGDMIGTGIFGTTGFALADMGSAALVLGLWVLGGIVAISGALSYAELSSIWPEVGGEYVYLKNIFGRLPAFMTGWVSLFVGFFGGSCCLGTGLDRIPGRVFEEHPRGRIRRRHPLF